MQSMPPRKQFSKVSGPTRTSCSALLKLPPEILIGIYEFALCGHKNLVRRSINKETGEPQKARPSPPGLLMACKQIHAEAITIFYSVAHFEFEVPRRIGAWARYIGPERTALVKQVHYNAGISDMKSVASALRSLQGWIKLADGAEIWCKLNLDGTFLLPSSFDKLLLWTQTPVQDYDNLCELRCRAGFFSSAGCDSSGDPEWLQEIQQKVKMAGTVALISHVTSALDAVVVHTN